MLRQLCRVVLWTVLALPQAGRPVMAGQAQPPKLHVEGRHLKDAEGRVIILRGVNKPGFEDCPDGWWNSPGGSLYSGIGVWRPQAIEANLDEVRRWGCNAIRFHTCIQWWKENPTTFRDRWRNVTYEKSFREMFKQVVRLAGERGLYVIVDLYSTAAGAAEQEPLPWPPYAKKPGSIGSEQEFLELWTTIARELARHARGQILSGVVAEVEDQRPRQSRLQPALECRGLVPAGGGHHLESGSAVDEGQL